MMILSGKRAVWPSIFLVLEILMLSACGGGGGGGSEPPSNTQVAPVATPPTILVQPQNATASDGLPASFTVTASGSAPLSYQWMRGGNLIAGATGAMYTITNVTMADNSTQFSVDISNSAGTVHSVSASLTVMAIAPQIVTQPQAQTLLPGNLATFSVGVSGTLPLTFQWRKNGVNIPGATTATYALSASAIDSGVVFDCLVANSSGSATSSSALLTVSAISAPPTITTQPQNNSVSSGQSAAFSVAVTGTSPFTFQWLRNGIAIAGANTQTFNVSPATILNHLDSYKVTVGNTAGVVTSDSASLSVASQPLDLIAGVLGGPGRVDGQGMAARFTQPGLMASDNAGNLYVSDKGAIRKVAPNGTTTTIAGKIGDIGFVNGPSNLARFGSSLSFAIDVVGDLFVLDIENHVIRRIDSTGIVSTYAGTGGSGVVDGAVATAEVGDPRAAVFDSNNNLFFVDHRNCNIRKITPGGVVSTFAGPSSGSLCGYADGIGSAARFTFPKGIAIDASDNLYVADWGDNTIRKITQSAVVTTLAGSDVDPCSTVDGAGAAARFCAPYGLTIDANSNLYTTDLTNTIRKISAAGQVTTLAGTGILGSGQYADGLGALAGFSHATGIVSDAAGNLVVADTENATLRKVSPSGLVSTWAGAKEHTGYRDGAAGQALFNGLNGVCGDPFGNVFVADSGNDVIRKISPSGIVSVFAGTVGSAGSIDGPGVIARFNSPADVACDSSGNVYVSDTSNLVVRKITSAGVVSTLAGVAGQSGSVDGSSSTARFGFLFGIDVDNSGNVYVADYGNNTIRKITSAGVVSTLAGNASAPDGYIDDSGSAARFSEIVGLAVDGNGNVFVTDVHKTIRKISPAGAVTTFAGSSGAFPAVVDGTGISANFARAVGLAIDSGNNIYVAESVFSGSGGGVIRKITPSAVVTTIVGVPIDFQLVRGVSLGPLPGSLSSPWGIAVIPSGSGTKLAVTDENSILSVIAP